MPTDQDALRDWHRLFGLLLTDFFTGSPFTVEVERDVSEQQQFLDVVILRRGRGRFVGRLPDGLDGLAAHNLITFKSHRETLDDWAMKELVGHYVAYRKLVSASPSELLSEKDFRGRGVLALKGRQPMICLRTDLLEMLRSMARSEEPPSAMLSAMVAKLGPETADRPLLVRYFSAAFCFTNGQAYKIFGWFPDGTGTLQDAGIDALMSKRIDEARSEWDKPGEWRLEKETILQ